MKLFAIFGAAFGMLAVASGAFAAHGLKSFLDEEMLAHWETGARYQMYHALGLFAAAWLAGETHTTAATVGGWSFIAGILIFSGSLYLLATTGVRWLGAITPIGGVALIAGWIALLIASTNL